MLKILLLSVACNLLLHVSFAQHKTPHLSIGVNPLSLAESQLSLGPCAGYRFNDCLGAWTEGSFIFANSYMPKEWKKISGLRLIGQLRYFIGNDRQTFLAPEFRYKNYSFNNRDLFINATNADTIKNFPFRENQMLIGGAFVVGRQIFLSKKKNVFIEFTFGLGAKDRHIKRTKVPAGYKRFESHGGSGLSINYEEEMAGRIYVPLSCRFMWNIK